MVNDVQLKGIFEDEFEYSHSLSHGDNNYTEDFYKTRVIVKRLSGNEDFVPIVVPESLLIGELENPIKGKYVEVYGHLKTRNSMGEDGRFHLEIFVYVKWLQINENISTQDTTNIVVFEGRICKRPVFRITPFGRRITDFMVAIYNEKSSKSYYIPCIVWGDNAWFARDLQVGDKVELSGRLQSREYFKKLSEGNVAGEYRTAYEISAGKIIKI